MKISKLKIIVFLAILLLLTGVVIISRQNYKLSQIKTACINQHCFQIEVAKTAVQQERGLMYRKSLAKNQGMLFVYPQQGIYSFWMKNMLIPLDIIWIDKNRQIVFIQNSAMPCSEVDCDFITPDTSAKYILEINAGLADRLHLALGDVVSFQ